MSQAADSAGVPFAGREFQPHPFEGDDGSAPEQLAEALNRWQERADDENLSLVVTALQGSRVLVPLMAQAGDIGHTADGKKVEKSQELSVVSVAGPGHTQVAVAFSDVEALARWRAEARPVPVEAEKVAAWVLDEQMTRLVINPSSPSQCVLRRGAVVAVLTGNPWQAPWRDPEVRSALEAALDGEDAEVASVESGWSLDGGEGPDLLVTLSLAPGLDKQQRQQRHARWSHAWASDPTLAHRVDGIRVAIVPR